MKNLKKDLQAITREIKALENKMQRLISVVDKSQKTGTKNKPKAKKLKAKPVKSTAVRKNVAAFTATDQVLKIIKRSKKGVDVTTLKTKTGFEDKKVRNIVFRASKDGKIKKAGRGIYVAA